MGEAAVARVDFDDYLALEESSEQKHEWLDGRVYAMAGGTLSHGELGAAMTRELGNLALTCGCRVFSSDVKVRVLATGLATYPDASVVCGEVATDPASKMVLVNPALLVEVLSDSTEAYDRGEKFIHYQQMPSLRDYVLVSQHAKRIQVFSRDSENQWTLRMAGPGQSVPLTAMRGVIEVDRVYVGVTLAPAPLPVVDA